MSPTSRQPVSISFFWPLMTILILFLLELVLILRINDMFFLALFDDAYILYEQARNILSGHYGHNPGEISAPCSSLLWPFLLAPLTPLPFFEWSVLFLNLGIVIAIVRVQYLIIAPIFSQPPEGDKIRSRQMSGYILLFSMIFIPNLILQLFSGMETALQVLLVHLIILGLIHDHQTGRIPSYLMIGLILSPLLRYESLAIVCPALIYLYGRGHRRGTVLAGLSVIMILVSFSLYFYVHDIGLLPSSIVAKNIHQHGPGNPVGKIGINFLQNLINPFSLPLVILTASLLPVFIFRRYRQFRGLAAVVAGGGLLHLMFGHIGPLPLFRYEAYVISALALGAIYIYMADVFQRCRERAWAVVFSVIPFILLSLPSLVITALIPAIANATYRHPYQMHRLATEFYPRPVAVNDMGWVTYKNSAYVLDLWGVGSHEALRCGLRRNSLECVADLAGRKNIHLVMITNSWFKRVPGNWIKIGEYHPGDNPFPLDIFVRGIVNHVDFYVTDRDYLEDAVRAIKEFRQTIPPAAEFRFSLNIS